jgi:hypothetical protein
MRSRDFVIQIDRVVGHVPERQDVAIQQYVRRRRVRLQVVDRVLNGSHELSPDTEYRHAGGFSLGLALAFLFLFAHNTIREFAWH